MVVERFDPDVFENLQRQLLHSAEGRVAQAGFETRKEQLSFGSENYLAFFIDGAQIDLSFLPDKIIHYVQDRFSPSRAGHCVTISTKLVMEGLAR